VRILLGMPDKDSLGGPIACEPPFVAELRRRGVTVAEETYVYGEQLGGTGLRRRVARVLRVARRLRRRLATEDFDLVHLNTAFDAKAVLRDAATLRLLRPQRCRIFLKFHGSNAALLRDADPLMRGLGRSVLARADGIGVLSTEERNSFVAAGADARKIFVVKNVVEELPAAIANRDARAFAARHEGAGGVPWLLFISRFVRTKGLLEVIRACRIVRERGYDFKLLCVGDGPARGEAEAETDRLCLRSLVHFCGLVPEAEAAEFYANSVMLVFPTYHAEGFPMVIFKSLAAGLPVITTRIRAAADYLTEPDNCFWVEPQNPEQLAERIITLLDEPQTRAAMRRNNLTLAEKFTADAVTPEYLEIYRQLIEERRAGRVSHR